MTRLIFFAFLLALAALALVAVVSAFGPGERGTGRGGGAREDTMPGTFRTFAYVALLLLMLGVTSGWIGGL